MNFTKWIDTLIEEKDIDTEATFEIETETDWHLMPYGVVIEAIKSAPNREQAAIKNMMVRIDFANGDIKDYLRHLAQALV